MSDSDPIADALASVHMSPGEIAAARIKRFGELRQRVLEQREQDAAERAAYAEIARREDAMEREWDRRIKQAREDGECDRRGIERG